MALRALDGITKSGTRTVNDLTKSIVLSLEGFDSVELPVSAQAHCPRGFGTRVDGEPVPQVIIPTASHENPIDPIGLTIRFLTFLSCCTRAKAYLGTVQDFHQALKDALKQPEELAAKFQANLTPTGKAVLSSIASGHAFSVEDILEHALRDDILLCWLPCIYLKIGWVLGKLVVTYIGRSNCGMLREIERTLACNARSQDRRQDWGKNHKQSTASSPMLTTATSTPSSSPHVRWTIQPPKRPFG